MDKKYFKWRLLCTSLVVVLSIASAYHFIDSWSNFEEILLLQPDCDPGESLCAVTSNANETIELSIKQTHMPVLTSIQSEVRTQKIPVQKIYIEFRGTEMDMGKFHTTLQRRQHGLYTSQTILPTCAHEQMMWNAVVHIESRHKHFVAPFLLVTQRSENE